MQPRMAIQKIACHVRSDALVLPVREVAATNESHLRMVLTSLITKSGTVTYVRAIGCRNRSNTLASSAQSALRGFLWFGSDGVGWRY